MSGRVLQYLTRATKPPERSTAPTCLGSKRGQERVIVEKLVNFEITAVFTLLKQNNYTLTAFIRTELLNIILKLIPQVLTGVEIVFWM